MKYGQLIPYAEKCIHLGNTVSSNSTERSLRDSSITELNIKTNNLLSEFSFSESITLSRLFSSYCMNVFGSPLWKYNNHYNIERLRISLGYEPADLTVHPPRIAEGGFIFSYRCLVFPQNVFKRKPVLLGIIEVKRLINVVFQHIHSNPIFIILTFFR